jgi:phosphoribosylformimino-5-aminoimidazole carboxamide ribotide isomerase
VKFRPCIDIHNGQVKQIVGGSLKDELNQAEENYISTKNASWFANLYKKDNLVGGHIILLNSRDSKYFQATKNQGLEALNAYPNGLQIGGGITSDNAKEYIEAGASHVIVTSYIFEEGRFMESHAEKLAEMVGKEKVVIDLSCRKRNNKYYVVTHRWQRFTTMELTYENMDKLANYCDEFLIHGVDVEGLSMGIEEPLVVFLSEYQRRRRIPITYAGGIGSWEDLGRFRLVSGERLDITIGSALDIFGGTMSYSEMVKLI